MDSPQMLIEGALIGGRWQRTALRMMDAVWASFGGLQCHLWCGLMHGWGALERKSSVGSWGDLHTGGKD